MILKIFLDHGIITDDLATWDTYRLFDTGHIYREFCKGDTNRLLLQEIFTVCLEKGIITGKLIYDLVQGILTYCLAQGKITDSLAIGVTYTQLVHSTLTECFTRGTLNIDWNRRYLQTV